MIFSYRLSLKPISLLLWHIGFSSVPYRFLDCSIQIFKYLNPTYLCPNLFWLFSLKFMSNNKHVVDHWTCLACSNQLFLLPALTMVLLLTKMPRSLTCHANISFQKTAQRHLLCETASHFLSRFLHSSFCFYYNEHKRPSTFCLKRLLWKICLINPRMTFNLF